MQLGILGFLRRPIRSPRAFRWGNTPTSSAPPGPDDPAEGPAAEGAGAGAPDPDPEPVQMAANRIEPTPFHSERFGYDLVLPPAWQQVNASSQPGVPPVDGFIAADGVRVGIWSEPCPVRRLPPVLAADRAASLPLYDGFVVPFVAYASGSGRKSLEGRWLQGGRRWTVDVQIPPGEPNALEEVRDLLATLHLGC